MTLTQPLDDSLMKNRIERNSKPINLALYKKTKVGNLIPKTNAMPYHGTPFYSTFHFNVPINEINKNASENIKTKSEVNK